MKALILSSPGVTQLTEIPVPTLLAGKALVKMKAASMNRRDEWIKEGKYPGIKYGVTLGSDGSGVVDSVFSEADQHWVTGVPILKCRASHTPFWVCP
jgi:zinc-binding alcohol dehydrogenase/oxidoreductase